MYRFHVDRIGANEKAEEADFCDSETALLGFGVEAKFS
jgi:hypothetical protein